MLPTRWLLPLIWMLGTACSVPRLDLKAKACPCAEGWTCDTSRNACVRDGLDELRPIAADAGELPKAEADSAMPYPPDASMSEGGEVPPSVPDAGAVEAALPEAAVPDAAIADAGSPDAGGVYCESLPDTTWLYDGFEGVHLGFSLSSYGTGSSINTRHEGFSHSGAKSLRAETTQAGKSASASQWLSEPITDCTFYLSTHLFVDASVALSSFSVLSVTDQTGQGIRLRYTPQGLELQLDATATTLLLDSKTDVVGRWMQVEWIVKIGVEGEITAYVDGQQAVTAITNTQRPLGYSQVRLGMFGTAADQQPIVVYADDFVLKRKGPPLP